jgi:hypothetical protein
MILKVYRCGTPLTPAPLPEGEGIMVVEEENNPYSLIG